MSQQGKSKTKHLLDLQVRNQLGTPHQGGREVSKCGTNFLNYVQ